MEAVTNARISSVLIRCKRYQLIGEGLVPRLLHATAYCHCKQEILPAKNIPTESLIGEGIPLWLLHFLCFVPYIILRVCYYYPYFLCSCVLIGGVRLDHDIEGREGPPFFSLQLCV